MMLLVSKQGIRFYSPLFYLDEKDS